MMLICTEQGLLDRRGEPLPQLPFAGRSVTAGAAADGRLAVSIDRHEIWILRQGDWQQEARLDANVNCLAWVGDKLLIGTSHARLAWLDEAGLRWDGACDDIAGRDDWSTPWGGPPDVRTLAVAADDTIYADIHVGWIIRSRAPAAEQPRDWQNLRQGLNKDVHQIIAHPRRAATVAAATARAFHISQDQGDTFERRANGLTYDYCRACACFPDRDIYLLSSSRGPHGEAEAQLHWSDDEGRHWHQASGLPATSDRNINTHQLLALSGGRAYAVYDDHALYQTSDYGASWRLDAANLPRIHALLKRD